MEKQRLTALKTRIKPIIEGKYVKQEGFEPNYVAADGRHYSRIRVLGTVVDKFKSETKSFSSITIDDASGTIRAKAFNSNILDDVEKGDIVDAIGKVKEYQEEIFFTPEVMRKVEPNWVILRELELREDEGTLQQKKKLIEEIRKETSDVEELKMVAAQKGMSEQEVEQLVESPEEEPEQPADNEATDKVLKLIEENDSGQGCDYSVLIEKSGLDEEALDKAINKILEEGTCFEPRPGKIKKL